MTEFTDYPITTDPDTLIQEFVEELQSYWPNWQPDQGSLSYRQAAALLNLIAEGRDLASLVPGEIFRTMGESLYNLPPNKAEPARADTTWVMRDNAGYGPIPVGTLVSVDGILFETTDEVSVPSGSTQATPIGIAALDAGAAASGLGAAGGVVELEEAFEFVAAVTLIDATSGGEDDEDQDAYMARLVDLLQLMSPVPILARDLSKLAKTFPGVERAVAIDNWNADTGTGNQPGHATVALVDEVGGQVPQATKDGVNQLLTGPSDRLLQAVIHVIDPTWTNVDVTWTGICYPNQDPAVVEASGNSAVALLLDPSMWGQPPSGETREWFNKPIVSLYDVAGALEQVEGLDRITAITIGLNGGAQTAADHNLTGVAPLARPGVIAGTVNEP